MLAYVINLSKIGDLLHTNSLQDHAAALALVSARPAEQAQSNGASSTTVIIPHGQDSNDPDLRRPYELQTLHDNIKLAFGSRINAAPTPAIRELEEARNSVTRAILRLGIYVQTHSSKTVEAEDYAADQGEDEDDELAAWS